MDVQRLRAGISKAVLLVGRNDKRLSFCQDDVFFVDPHIGFAGDHGKHLLDRMRMRRRSCGLRHPLLEYAKLGCANTCIRVSTPGRQASRT